MPRTEDMSWLDEREELMLKFLVQRLGELNSLSSGNDDLYEHYRHIVTECDRHATATQMRIHWVSPFELMREKMQKIGALDFDAEEADCFMSVEFVGWFENAKEHREVQSILTVLRVLLGRSRIDS